MRLWLFVLRRLGFSPCARCGFWYRRLPASGLCDNCRWWLQRLSDTGL